MTRCIIVIGLLFAAVDARADACGVGDDDTVKIAGVTLPAPRALAATVAGKHTGKGVAWEVEGRADSPAAAFEAVQPWITFFGGKQAISPRGKSVIVPALTKRAGNGVTFWTASASGQRDDRAAILVEIYVADDPPGTWVVGVFWNGDNDGRADGVPLCEPPPLTCKAKKGLVGVDGVRFPVPPGVTAATVPLHDTAIRVRMKEGTDVAALRARYQGKKIGKLELGAFTARQDGAVVIWTAETATKKLVLTVEITAAGKLAEDGTTFEPDAATPWVELRARHGAPQGAGTRKQKAKCTP
jgi:hypothetical protein